MKYRLFKRIALRINAILLCVLLCGCTVQAEFVPQLPQSTALPPPPLSDEPRSAHLELYFLMADSRLGAEQREISWKTGTSRAKAAVEALCAGPNNPSFSSVVPRSLKLVDVELSGDICTVDFSGTLSNDRELLIMRAAIAATVFANEGSLYTDVLINGVQPGYKGRPLGIQKPVEIPLDSYISALEKEYQVYEQEELPEAGAFETRDAQIYFLDTSGSLLLSDARTLRYDKQAELELIVAALVGELAKGPVESIGREPVLPANMRLLKTAYMQTAQKSDLQADNNVPLTKGILELYFEQPKERFNEAAVFACLIYSVTGFCPNIEGVRIFIGETATDASKILGLKDGANRDYFLRSDFKSRLGHTITLNFPDADGLGLYPVLRALPQVEAESPKARISELFRGPADPGISLSLYNEEELLSVSLQGNMAVVNWAPGFSKKLLEFVKSGVSHIPPNARAQMYLYSVINTLSEIPGITRVWMLEDGRRIDETIDRIYLGNPLFANPGFMLV